MKPEQRKRFHDRAVRNLRALRKEKETYGDYNDGSGKRYRIGVYFLLAGELERATDAFDEFDREFPDDIGEPIFLLYSALAAYRCGDLTTAQARLKATMLSNLFLLPHLSGLAFDREDCRPWSNWGLADYLVQTQEFLQEPTKDECAWIGSEWNTPAFVTSRNRQLATL